MRNEIAVGLGQALLAGWLVLWSACASAGNTDVRTAARDGIITARSHYRIGETVERLKAAIANRGIRFFGEVDQGALAGDAGIGVPPSKLLMFGNPALGARFVILNPLAGLDWPVRILVREDAGGAVWVSYWDFADTARRYSISPDDPAFATASRVVDSIVAAVRVAR